MKTNKVKIERGSGNVFADLGPAVPSSESAFHIVASGWSGPVRPVWMLRKLAGQRRGGFADTHNRLSFPLPVRCLVSDATAAGHDSRPLPELLTRGLPKVSDEGFETSDSSKSQFRIFRTRGFELSGAQAQAHEVLPQPPKSDSWLNSLISQWLSQSDDFRTRSGKNGEYGANRE